MGKIIEHGNINEIERNWTAGAGNPTITVMESIINPIPKTEVTIEKIIAVVIELLKSEEAQDNKFRCNVTADDHVEITAINVYMKITLKLFDDILDTINDCKNGI